MAIARPYSSGLNRHVDPRPAPASNQTKELQELNNRLMSHIDAVKFISLEFLIH